MLSVNRKSITLASSIFLIGASFVILFARTYLELIHDWTTNDNFSHGFLILPISGYLIYQKRHKIAELSIRPYNLGILVILVGLLLYFIGNIAAELFTMRFSILITIFGLSLFLLGKKITRQLAVPIAYLIFMIPIPSIIWNKIAFPLQLTAAKLTIHVVQAIGIPILREGNILFLPNATLEVVDACSGLRSLTSLLALSAAFAYIASLHRVNQWILFLSAIPIAMVSNITRLTFTACIARLVGQEAAQGFLHELSGIFVFVVALIIFYFLYKFLKRLEKNIFKDNPVSP